jgi:serine/threonine-protein phosphatase 2A regulatory subunit B''
LRWQIKPKDPPCITAEDLRVSGMSGIFFSILADAKQFRDYNYRENTMHQEPEEA